MMDWLVYANQGATRNRPIDPKLVNTLSFLPSMGVTAKVISGGQAPKGSGGPRTGSKRHDDGLAADVDFYMGGRKLDWNNPQDLPVLQDIVRNAKARGATGIGAGDDYMGPGRFHIGFGTPAVWGAGGKSANAPDWLRQAYYDVPQGDIMAGGGSDVIGGGGDYSLMGGEGADTMGQPMTPEDMLADLQKMIVVDRQPEAPPSPAEVYASTGALDQTPEMLIADLRNMVDLGNTDAATGLPMAMRPPRGEEAFIPTEPTPSNMRGTLSAPGFEAAGQFAEAAGQGPTGYLPNIALSALSGLSGAINYGIGGAADLAIAAGAPKGSTQRLARDIAAMPEAFAGSPASVERIATAPRIPEAPSGPRVEPPVTLRPPVQPQSLGELSQTARGAAAGKSQALETLATQAMPDPETIQAAKRLGIDEFLQPDQVTTNQSYRELAQAVKSVPGSLLRQQELQNFETIAKRADSLIEEIGGTTDLSGLNANVKSRMEQTQAELDAAADVLYKRLRQTVPATMPAQTKNITDLINKRALDLGGFDKLSSLEKRILARLKPTVENVPASSVLGPDGRPVTAASKREKPPTYANLDDVRRDLTAAKYKRQGPFKDADTGLIKLLEGELMKDQKASIAGVEGASELFAAAQGTVRTRKALENDMAALFGKALDRSLVPFVERSVGKLAAGVDDDFIKLIKVVPENMRQEVVASGLSKAFGKNAKNQTINFNSFSRWYDGLEKNRTAKAALMSNLPPEARKQLADLARVSKGIAASSRERITTGRIMAVRQEIERADTLMENIYGIAKRSAIGVPLEMATTAVGLPGAGTASAIASALTRNADKPKLMQEADKLIASPQFEAMAKSFGRSDERVRVRNFAKSREFMKFVKSAGIENPEAWLNAAILGSVASQEGQQ